MNKAWFFKIFIVTAVVLLSSCKEDEHFIVVTDLKGNHLIKITDGSVIESIAREWNSKTVVNIKKMPKFDWIVTHTKAETTNKWQYSKSGFAQLVDSKSKDIYRVNLNQLKNVISNREQK